MNNRELIQKHCDRVRARTGRVPFARDELESVDCLIDLLRDVIAEEPIGQVVTRLTKERDGQIELNRAKDQLIDQLRGDLQKFKDATPGGPSPIYVENLQRDLEAAQAGRRKLEGEISQVVDQLEIARSERDAARSKLLRLRAAIRAL